MLEDLGDGRVKVKIFNQEGDDLSTTVEKKSWYIGMLDKNSHAVWVQVIQDAIEKQFEKEEVGRRPIFEGDSSTRAFSAIYGHTSTNGFCNDVDSIAEKAKTIPMTISTNATKGELASNHAYSLLEGRLVNDQSALVLRNPWGFIKEKDGLGDSSLWGPDIVDLGDGTFQIPTETLRLQLSSTDRLRLEISVVVDQKRLWLANRRLCALSVASNLILT
ncbi:MAG: hypothetical protein Q9179_000294 [Wetmoreana sp. 5 TL-2023]